MFTERVQAELGACVAARQRLAWAKVSVAGTRFNTASRIRSVLETDAGRAMPRLMGEVLMGNRSAAELVIARNEMQVRVMITSP